MARFLNMGGLTHMYHVAMNYSFHTDPQHKATQQWRAMRMAMDPSGADDQKLLPNGGGAGGVGGSESGL